MAKEKRAVRPKDWLYAVGRALLMMFYRVIYRLKAEGLENIPEEGPVLLCSNHVAIKDPLLIASMVKRQVCYMAKAELFRSRFLGAILRKVGAFPVARGSGGADALARACSLLEENAVVGVFIEGHRSEDGELQRPKTGAAMLAYRSKATVVPVCIAAQSRWRSKPFQRTVIKFGAPLSAETLNIADDSSLQLRRASRTMMEKIAAMREEAFLEMGVAKPEQGAE